jgi:hypothetical protein
MNARGWRLTPLLILMPLLAGCNFARGPDAPTDLALAVNEPLGRRVEAIRRQIAAACPTPLRPETLDWLAAAVKTGRASAVLAAVNDIDRIDRETEACRSVKEFN